MNHFPYDEVSAEDQAAERAYYDQLDRAEAYAIYIEQQAELADEEAETDDEEG